MMKDGSNIIWSSKVAAQVTQGKCDTDWRATGLSIDTRTLKPGDLFIALKGDNRDGHLFVKDALDKGACACLVDHRPEGVSPEAPLLVVKNTLDALEALARESRNRTGAKIVAITGSVGKTGTKEMMAEVLSSFGQTHASQASYNNHWGVPFSLGSMHEGTDFGVFEVGMNHSGEITPLVKMIKPHVAVITTVAPVHIENFDSEQQIAQAKAEIFDGVVAGGYVVLPADNKWFEYLKNLAEDKGLQVVAFGENSSADVRITECMQAANGSRIKARVFDQDVEFTLMIPGKHIAINALTVLAVARLFGEDLKECAKKLSRTRPVTGRGKKEMLDIGESANPVTLIDESYNASPVAMNAAFKVLALIDPGRGGRRIAVLGDMLELGKDAKKQHEQLALPLQAADVQLVYTCGTLMKSLYDALPVERRGAHKDNSVELAKIVPDVLTPGDVVMVKGSHGSKMGVVVEALRALPEKLKKKNKSKEHAV
jgi:UDP-N-acetylmuramoyl-tripeptide--D-alanyl-D-alanine ligase